ncbi:simple sugar transport system substrate-binding protein/ribose transport system substrate-binding protein [Microbacterium proteolyticum]|uniref:Simple sugar transport system substrate-binding protein/ribose transport system substrate-binding protein n=1 Tax=Microbacterium proteolyticum TaxID=1572644 RepID=A0A7W5CKG5_9MICO|nr:sugar ABC transporter substrate-binding protein [Microbacterium proteolyticum]MBB3159348.1 simple sugar transport system substrate-binding protein/ribose transport system substrate-binding protein [Microbacterium proteolyticum]
MRTSPITGLALLGAGALLLAGCAGGTSTTDAGGSGDPADTPLSYSQPHTDPFQNAENVGSMERFAELGYATIPATNADRDAAQQITDIQTLINKGAKGLVISVGDADAIVPAIEYANDSSVPIVAIDEAPASGKIAMIVRADNVKMGALACEEMGKRVAADAVVITLDGDPVTSNGRDRTNGFNDCMAANYPGVKLVNVATEWDPAKAASGIETALNQYGNVAGIYNQSDATFFPTILDTLKSAGKLVAAGESGHIVQVSVDASPMAMTAIRDGWLDAAVAQPMTDYIDYGVEYLTRAIKGETFEAGETDHGSTIEERNGNLVDLLPTPVVTKDNVEDPELWGNKQFALDAFGATK